MAKKQRKSKKLKKERKLTKERVEREVNKRVNDSEEVKSLQKLPKIDPQHLDLLKDFAGPKPKPPKRKGLYSGRKPPTPPAPLFDLIHRFLRDFKYVKAAHGLRTDNQKRPGHNMHMWIHSSQGRYPDLLELFLQWEEQNPVKDRVLETDDTAPKRSEAMALGVYGAEQPMSRRAFQELQKTRKGDDSEDDSDISSDSYDIADDLSEEAEALMQSRPAKSNANGKATSDSGSSSDSSSDSESSEADAEVNGHMSEEDSDTSSSSSSSDESVDEVKTKPTVSATTTSLKRKRATSASSSATSDSGSSDSSSDETGNGSDDAKSRPTNSVEPPSTASTLKRKRSSSDSSSGTSSESESNVEESSDGSKTLSDPTKASTQMAESSPASSSSSSSSEQETTALKPQEQIVQSLKSEHLSKKAKLEKNSFSRIPQDIQVEEKFRSNKYVPYDYAESAYQRLSVTKGKNFTKAKNKGKKGSYRGGAIDISGGKGIKFDD